jgi:hypothetical protein
MELSIKTVTDIIKGDNYFLNNTMNNPKEKATYLFVKYFERLPDSIYSNDAAMKEAKIFSIIAIDEMIVQNGELYLQGLALDYYKEKNAFLFAVKQEIKKL